MLIHQMSQKILNYLPRYADRVKEIQEANSEKMVNMLSNVNDDPQLFY